MHETISLLVEGGFPPIRRRRLQTLQLNLGYRCNMSCVHCHVSAGPNRTEEMTRETIDQALRFIDQMAIGTLDLTGGAPELNPHFRDLVSEARARGVHVMDRCNLTILAEPGQEGLAQFLADNDVEIVASLPCYELENVDKQRGKGAFESSVRAIESLNSLGYGRDNARHCLSLVYNPQGPSLPPSQIELEKAYKNELGRQFGITFDRLLTIANMPIGRFGSVLVSKGQFNAYMSTLREAHSDDNLDAVMCRTMVSVDWQGDVYDCDFNQMLGLPMQLGGQKHVQLSDLLDRELDGNPIVVRDHCFACTAGQGSSCGGALN
ncbi:MAG: radical SAM/Cys-rich protein [Gammaproteobacteria bacterium]|jgi:radical SAM/Cys-rich protein